MRAEELENLTPDQLVAEANACFQEADRENPNLAGGHERRLLLHLKAQFYLTTAARKRADATAEEDRRRERRRFWVELGLEVAIILLIGWEIREGREQAKILAEIDRSTSATAPAMQAAAKSLELLWEKENQRPSLLVLTLVEADLAPNRVTWRPLEPRGMLGTGHSLGNQQHLRSKSFFLRNVGNAWAKHLSVRANVTSPAHFECIVFRTTSVGTQKPCELAGVSAPDLPPDADADLQPKAGDLGFFLYFTAPEGMKDVQIYFTVSGDNLPGEPYSVSASLP